MRGPDKLSTDLVSAVRSDMHALCQMAPGELSGGGVVVLCGVGGRAVAVTGYNLWLITDNSLNSGWVKIAGASLRVKLDYQLSTCLCQ